MEEEFMDAWAEQLGMMLVANYFVIRLLLLNLPIRIVLPDFHAETDDEVLLRAVDRAKTLVADEPLSLVMKIRMQRVLLDWLVAYDLLDLVQNEEAVVWRLEGLDYALERIEFFAEMLAAELGVDLDTLE